MGTNTTFADAVSPHKGKWTQLSVDLGFCDSAFNYFDGLEKGKECDNRKVYMLWLWLDTLLKQTFERQSEGGNMEIGVVPSMGS